MDLDLKGKIALITGASQGIGRGIALVLADEGCDLILVARNAALLEETATAACARGAGAARTIVADLSVHAEIGRVAEAAGPVDVLVNNAGAIPSGALADVDDEAWRAAWNLKVFGYINLSRALYPVLKQRSGVIVNIIGTGADTQSPFYIAGASGNASLAAFTRSLGRGAVKDGMRVVGIHPGPIDTQRRIDFAKATARREFGDENRWTESNKDLPYGRAGTPEEIGAAVAFLASPRAAYINATVLTIDGGLFR